MTGERAAGPERMRRRKSLNQNDQTASQTDDLYQGLDGLVSEPRVQID